MILLSRLAATRLAATRLAATRLAATRLAAVLLLTLAAGPATAQTPDVAARPLAEAPFRASEVEAGVRAVLDAQVAAWNAGSIPGYMAGYAETDSLVFLSGQSVRRGWEEALYGYLRSYPDTAAMGMLSFDDVTVVPLSGVHALVWGRWRLRLDGPAEAQPGGLFTLLFVRTDQGWRIVHDHTS